MAQADALWFLSVLCFRAPHQPRALLPLTPTRQPSTTCHFPFLLFPEPAALSGSQPLHPHMARQQSPRDRSTQTTCPPGSAEAWFLNEAVGSVLVLCFSPSSTHAVGLQEPQPSSRCQGHSCYSQLGRVKVKVGYGAGHGSEAARASYPKGQHLLSGELLLTKDVGRCMLGCLLSNHPRLHHSQEGKGGNFSFSDAMQGPSPATQLRSRCLSQSMPRAHAVGPWCPCGPDSCGSSGHCVVSCRAWGRHP